MDSRSNVNAPESMTPWLRSSATAEFPAPSEQFGVGEVAALVGVSVRTLHHWDSIGLVSPHDRTIAGYRTYSEADIARIHRVLVYRELGFSLTRIAALLDDPTVDETAQLARQRDLLEERIAGLRRMADSVGRILASRESGTGLSARQQAEIFGRGWRADWADEAHDRWGDSEQWSEFEQNAAMLSDIERGRIHDEGQALYGALAEAKDSGLAPGSDTANALAEQHRAMIGRLFSCSHSMHVCIAQHYVQDPRFLARFDAVSPGFAAWLKAVIDANARRHGVDPENAVWE